MANNIGTRPDRDLAARLAEFQNLPILYEDDPEWDMGESNLHALAEHILRYGIAAHLAAQPRYRVFSNLNLHYQPRLPSVYVSPDVMVVTPLNPREEDVRSYFIGRDGPAPVLAAEVLSEDTAQKADLEAKVYLYAMIGVEEYVLVDGTTRFLPERLLLKRLQPDRTWTDEQDQDGGITSRLGFRIIWNSDDRLRVLDAATGRHYPRPDEAHVEAEARRRTEEQLSVLQEELTRLRGASAKVHGKRSTKRRRKS